MWTNRRESTNILQKLSTCHPYTNNSIIQYRVSMDAVFLQYCLYFCISENVGIFCICVIRLWQWGCIKWICIQCLWQWRHILPFHNLVLKPNVIITCIMVWFYSFSIPRPFIFCFCNLICFDLYWVRGDAYLPLYMGFRTQVKILDSAHNKQNNSPYLGSHPVYLFRMIYI